MPDTPRIPNRRRRHPVDRSAPAPRITPEDAAAVILTLTASAETDADLERLAASLRGSMRPGAMTDALDLAAWRVARLIDLSLALSVRPLVS